MIGVDPKVVDVPVLGGHAGITILPILSQVRYREVIFYFILVTRILVFSFLLASQHVLNSKTALEVIFLTHVTFVGVQVTPKFTFTDKEVAYLTNRIQNGGTEVVEVKLSISTR